MTSAANSVCDAPVSSKASVSSAPYQLQTWGRAGSALRASMLVAGHQKQDRPATCGARLFSVACSSKLLINWRGLNCAPSFPHSHRSAYSPDRRRTQVFGPLPVQDGVRQSHKAERVAAARCVSATGTSANSTCRNAYAHQPIVRRIAAALVHVRRLSSSPFSSGIDPNEIGLTDAKNDFAPGAKAHD